VFAAQSRSHIRKNETAAQDHKVRPARVHGPLSPEAGT
jgi:hypothetical protein